MIETQEEREMALILKCYDVNFNNELLTGEQAFQNMVVCNLFKQNYIIDWDKTPVEIKTQ